MADSRLVSSFILKNLSHGVSSGSFTATVLLADMRGFTRLTDEAMSRGDGGAEWISGVLSSALTPFIDFVHEEGGFIAEFEGDASLAVFPGDRPELLGRARQVLRDISKEIDEDISFTATSGSGSISWGVSGSEGILYQLFHGASVAGAFKLDQILPEPGEWIDADPETTCFFPSLITEKTFIEEFRTVFPAFLSLQVSTIEGAQSFFRSVCNFSSAMDGFLNGTHLRGRYATVLVVFGAPKAFESDARRCGELVLGLRALFPELRAGVTAGTAYAGFIGSGSRCDYTVLGSRVNLASRLCDHAEPGEILVNSDYSELVRSSFTVRQGRTLQLKGFKEPQSSFILCDSSPDAGDQHQSRFVGRKEERALLARLLSSCIEENRLIAVNILGEPGIGKSRLLREVINSCPPEVFTLVLSGDEFMAERDLNVWRRALQLLPDSWIRDMLESSEPGELRGELKWAESHLADLSDDRKEASSTGENAVYSISILLDAMADNRKFIIGVENPGSMDPATLKTLESFLGRRRSGRGLFITTSRWEEKIPEFLRCGNTIDLGPLDIQETVEKLSEDTGIPVHDDIAGFLFKRSSGNPLYLEELSAMVHQDRLKGTWNTWQDTEHLLPGSLGSLLESRIDHFSSEMREAVSAASVLGLEFDPEVLRHMMSVRSASITRGLSLGIWKLSHYGRLAFRQPLLREAAYRMLLVSTRKRIHRLAADVILKLYREPEGEHLVSLAMHAAKADYSEVALRYLEAAGDYCRLAHQNQQAIGNYTDLEYLSGDPDIRMRARGKKGAVLEVVGRWAEALDIYRISIDLADSDPSMVQHSCRMRISMGRLLMEQGNYDEAIAVLEKAEGFLSEEQEIVLGTVYANLGGSWLRKGEHRKAAEYIHKWHDITRKAGDKYSLAMVMGTLGVLAEESGEIEKAMEYYRVQTELAEETNQAFLASISIHNLGNLAMESGDYTLAETYLEKDLATSRKLGYRSSESVAMGSLSRILCYKGQFKKALEYAGFHLRVSQALGNVFREVSAFNDVIIVQIYSGAYSDAEETIRQKTSAIESTGSQKNVIMDHYLQGLLEMFRENLSEALQFIKTAVEYAEESGIDAGKLHYSLLGFLHLITGNTKAAENLLEKAQGSGSVSEEPDLTERLLRVIESESDPVVSAKAVYLADKYLGRIKR
ncbi:MAG: tetratricopeptide repeat protein [Candidatus Sabulitectum sp.]|nr:tetratricopeptide repeat protein [Candidatus Sabulitectum sp.]